MLFYEPLFVTFFLAFYALYLQATGALAKKCTLLLASALFYVWGEPVFVLVLLVSTANVARTAETFRRGQSVWLGWAADAGHELEE